MMEDDVDHEAKYDEPVDESNNDQSNHESNDQSKIDDGDVSADGVGSARSNQESNIN